MEKNGRITLIDKELSEKQQSLSRYIEHYTHIPFSGQTYSEWQMWVEMNKPYADHLKAKENEPKAEEEKPVRKNKNRDRKRGREVAVDCNNLYGAIKSIGETNGHICALCGFGHAYLSDVKRRGWMYESDIMKLSDAGIDAADYVTDEWYRAKYLTEEPMTGQAEEVPENCVSFNALGVRFKDNTEAQEFAMILQILGMTERDFTTAAFFALFDRFKTMTVPALLRVREKRIDRIAQGETGGKLKGMEASVTILDEMAAEDADNDD